MIAIIKKLKASYDVAEDIMYFCSSNHMRYEVKDIPETYELKEILIDVPLNKYDRFMEYLNKIENKYTEVM